VKAEGGKIILKFLVSFSGELGSRTRRNSMGGAINSVGRQGRFCQPDDLVFDGFVDGLGRVVEDFWRAARPGRDMIRLMQYRVSREISVAVGIAAGFAFLIGLGRGFGLISADNAMTAGFAFLIVTAISVAMAKTKKG